MRTITALFLVILALGVLVSGCSKASTQAPIQQPSGQSDVSIDSTPIEPDIGTLDETPVSDALPQ